MINKLLAILILLIPFISYSQSLPFYYEHNLSLYGKPGKIAEYYYEYHTQAKAHYYDHIMEYDALGRIKTHVKSNKDLLNPDSIPLTFLDIIDPRAITITYSFQYDHKNRFSRFSRHQNQEDVGAYQQDEEWKYDSNDMLTEHNFWEIINKDTILKNPSYRRIIHRDALKKILKIEKYAYSFIDKGIRLSEVTDFLYGKDVIDTITSYRFYNGTKILNDKKYNLTFLKYDPLNTDSVLFVSYTSADGEGQISKHSFLYDRFQRETFHLTTSASDDTLTKTERIYEAFKTTETTDSHSLEIYYDESGYEKYHEEFESGNSLAIHSDVNTRVIEKEKIKNALLEIWDPVTLFYRRDTEYIYYYNYVTGLIPFVSSLEKHRVYPNPSSGTIYLDDLESIQKLELISSDGKSIHLQPSSPITLNVPQGIYILCLSFSDASVKRLKVVIE